MVTSWALKLPTPDVTPCWRRFPLALGRLCYRLRSTFSGRRPRRWNQSRFYCARRRTGGNGMSLRSLVGLIRPHQHEVRHENRWDSLSPSTVGRYLPDCINGYRGQPAGRVTRFIRDPRTDRHQSWCGCLALYCNRKMAEVITHRTSRVRSRYHDVWCLLAGRLTAHRPRCSIGSAGL